ncbi:MAG: hypothetical protein POELPBGB_00407 [Bacteroidia bacterium]|nr:hypothetical protein [Bacteroidia bacterium]
MKFTVYNKPEANQDIYEASQWHEEQKPGLGYEFIDDVEEVLSYLETNPTIFQKKHGEIREAPLKRFSYVVLYQIEDAKTVIVFAVFHTSQDPKKKKKRIRSR